MNLQEMTKDELVAYAAELQRSLTASKKDQARLREAEEALRESEAKYRELVQNANSIFLRWNRSGEVTFLNEFGQNFFGYSEEEIVGQHVVGTIVPETESGGRDLRPLMEKICANPRGFEHNVNENMLRDGSRVWIEWTNKAIFDEQSQLVEIFSVGTDITERKRVQDALQNSERMMKSILSASPVAIGLAENRKMKWVNHAWEETFGLENHEYLDEDASTIYPSQEEYERVGQALYTHLSLGQVTQTDARFKRQNGSIFDGHIRMKALDPSNLAKGTIAAISDISERKRVEQALKESEDRYRALAENSLTGICVHQDGRLVYVNERYAKNLGYSTEELIGQSLLEIVAPEDRKRVEHRWRARLAGEKVPSQYEARHLSRDGNIRWLEVWATVIEHNGSSAILANVIDITERKAAEEALRESEKKYRTILETIADGYHEVDLPGNLTFVNDSLCEMLGYPREELLGVNYRKLMDEQNAKSVLGAYNKVYRTGKPNPGFNYQSIRKDGSKRDVSVSISPIKNADGKPRGFRGIMRDITERKKLQEQLYQAAKMEAIGTLAGGLAHDFNNLLQIVLGYADLIAISQETHEKDYQRARLIHDAAMRGRDLVNRILTFSRKVETKPRPIDLNHGLNQVDHLLA